MSQYLTNIFISFNHNTQRYTISVYSGNDDETTSLDFEMSLYDINLDKVAAYILQDGSITGAWERLAAIKGTDKLFLVLSGRYKQTVEENIRLKYPEAVKYIYKED